MILPERSSLAAIEEPGGSLGSSTSPPASSTTGGNAPEKRTSTTAGVPRHFWLEDWERQSIIGFHLKSPLEGYRRLTFMMLDADIVAVSPTRVGRVWGRLDHCEVEQQAVKEGHGP